jgi:hypothetical protein
MSKAAERSEAKALGNRFYFTGKPCKHGHIAKRYTDKGTCCECMSIDFVEKKENRTKQMRLNYAEKKSQYSSRMILWRASNKHKQSVYSSKKRSDLLLRTPKWLDSSAFEKIEEYYFTAHMLGMHTGEQYHVDHIVPLRGKLVSGLNVPWNLQILTKTDNLKKNNNFYV